ncbi:MAG: hypothetical protein U0787_15535 [Polyangia bacterium]
MSELVLVFDLQIEQIDAGEFRVKFDKPQHPELHMDKPASKDTAPNPSRILAAAIGNVCPRAFVLVCPETASALPVSSPMHGTDSRTEQKRLRIGSRCGCCDRKSTEMLLRWKMSGDV